MGLFTQVTWDTPAFSDVPERRVCLLGHNQIIFSRLRWSTQLLLARGSLQLRLTSKPAVGSTWPTCNCSYFCPEEVRATPDESLTFLN